MSGCDLQDANVRGANIVGASLKEMQSPLHMSLWVHTQSDRHEQEPITEVDVVEPAIPPDNDAV